jgi:homoserine dehydrogenase
MKRVGLILLGLGNVGGALLRQLLETREALLRQANLELAPVALADISGSLVDPEGIPVDKLAVALEAIRGGGVLGALPGITPVARIEAALGPGTVLADLTASTETGQWIDEALAAGSAVVLANKIPLARPWNEASGLFETSRLRYEVTVGAGLPVISTLQYLLETGDQAIAIEGCLSGTLGYLCAELEQGVPFSTAIEQARELGYTEPDPREDLGGKDVARKALILARTAGWPLEPEDIQVEALFPARLADIPVDQYMAAMHTQNASFGARLAGAMERGETLRYVARVGPAGGSVGLVSVPQNSALGALRGPGNYVALSTDRYADIPLVLAGPGAGPEVTAAGALGDILRLSREG